MPSSEELKPVAVKPLEWILTSALNARQKLVALDCFGNEFARLDMPKPDVTVEAFKAVSQDDYEAHIRSGLIHPAPTAADTLAWAVSRWNAEVANRPLVNVHRRSLDDTWRQIIRHLGGDPVALCGPSHDELMEEKDNQL